MSTFQIVVTGIFVALILVGVGVFAAFGGVLGGGSVGAVSVWGTADSQQIEMMMQALRVQDKAFQEVSYMQKNPATYEQDLVNAIASGSGPDLFLVTQEQLGALEDKIISIPYSVVPRATVANSFIDEAGLFATPQGMLALPFMIDPLVMYWNNDLFASAGVAQPPQYWNDFLKLAPKITSLDTSQNVRKSAVALGTWQNVVHAKRILSALFIQAGDPVTRRDEAGALVTALGLTEQAAVRPAESALRFYTEFANPSKETYSWNRSLQRSTDAFVAGDVAVYFGLGSERARLAERNPNLRFGMALLPQLQGGGARATYGVLTGLAIPRGAANQSGAVQIAQKLSGQAAIAALSEQTGLPPVRRDITLDTSASASGPVLVQSALIARGWADPRASATDDIFKRMIESVMSGKSTPAEAVSEASQEFRGITGM